jgi:hypothetical protein
MSASEPTHDAARLAHEPLTPMMALRLKNDGFGPNTAMYERQTLHDLLRSYTEYCEDRETPATVGGWLRCELVAEERLLNGLTLAPSEKTRLLANIALRCSCILGKPEGDVQDPATGGLERAAVECALAVPAPNPRYVMEEG